MSKSSGHLNILFDNDHVYAYNFIFLKDNVWSL